MGERHPDSNQLEAMLANYERLKEENAALRRLLVESRIVIPAQPKTASPTVPVNPRVDDAAVDGHLSKDAKIALFRSLFRGREDVYAVRTQFKKGRLGLRPCLDPRLEGGPVCGRGHSKEGGPEDQETPALTDDVVRQHLEGKQTIGIYPLLLDETCWFLAVDFDKKSWQDDAAVFLETCRDLGIGGA